MNVNCNECHKDFDIALKEKKHGKGIIEKYFFCSHCSTRYSSAFTNDRARKIQKQIRQLWTEIKDCRNVQLAEHKKAKIDRLTEENKQIMDSLKEQYASK